MSGPEHPHELAQPPWLRRPGVRPAIACGLVLLVLLAALTVRARAHAVRAEQDRVAAQLQASGSALSAAIGQRIALIAGLRAFVQSDFDRALDPAHVDPFAAAMQASAPGVRALQIVRDDLIRYVYPLEGNERALGLDLAHDGRDRVRQDYLRAQASRKLSISGPFELIQGGMGLVARQTVEQRGAAWGLVAVVLDVPALLQQAALPVHRNGLGFALRDATGRAFFGHAATFREDAVRTSIALPDGAWELAAAPRHGGWGDRVRGPVLTFALVGLGVALLLPTLIGMLLNRRSQRVAFLRALERKEIDAWKRAVRVIGHEVANSMGPISSLSYSARQLVDRPDKRHLLTNVFDTIDERARHLSTFLDQYARLARLPAPRRAPVAWPRLVASLQPLYPFVLDGPLPQAPAHVDEAQVQQVLINLLKNARESGSDPGEIRLGVVDVSSHVEVLVKDRGKGLDARALARAGEPFFTTKPGGTGLGLLLCREIAASHQGVLHLEPRPGGGTVARLVLPRV